MNQLIKTTLLLGALTILFVFVGDLIGGPQGAIGAFWIAVAMNFFAYWFSDKMVLAAYRAQPLAPEDAPEIYEIVKKITKRAGLPMPRIYFVPSASPNAFATGRNPNHAAVVVTKGIVDLLNKEELEGVLAHELAHVGHRDILLSSVAATLAGAISMLASSARWMFYLGDSRNREDRRDNVVVLLLVSILVPIAASLIQLAVSRSREYDADEQGARWSDNPLYLASALRKIDAASRQIPLREAEPSSAHLFILNPLSGGGFENLFSTHPPVEERIMRLEKMGKQ